MSTAQRRTLPWPTRCLGQSLDGNVQITYYTGLASVPANEFDDVRVKHILILSRQETPLYLLPVGWPA